MLRPHHFNKQLIDVVGAGFFPIFRLAVPFFFASKSMEELEALLGRLLFLSKTSVSYSAVLLRTLSGNSTVSSGLTSTPGEGVPIVIPLWAKADGRAGNKSATKPGRCFACWADSLSMNGLFAQLVYIID